MGSSFLHHLSNSTPLVGFVISSLRPFFGEDGAFNGPATAATPTKGDIVVPRWDVLVPRCSSEPMVFETAPPPPWPGKYLHFVRAFSACTSLYLRLRCGCAWHFYHSGMPIHNYVIAHRF